jgi:23S rRNA (cytosine1962-C5)-methyltransferase
LRASVPASAVDAAGWMAHRDAVPHVVLQPGRDRSVRRRHPWLLSGSVASVEGDPAAGDLLGVLSAEGEVLAHGHYSPRSEIRVRLLWFGKEAPGEEHLRAGIERAVARRREDPRLQGREALRLVNAEGDDLPGLVVDRYREIAVVRLSTVGMAVRREEISGILREVSGAASGYERPDATAARREGLPICEGPLWGDPPPPTLSIREGRRLYHVDLVGGQKTGFYLDQCDSRDLVESLAAGRRVLDLFAYTGGFAVAAALGGASAVTLVESSSTGLALARENLALNAPDLEAEIVRGDAFRFARGAGESFDLIILDPPPLARRRRDVGRACRAYKDLILHALRRAAPDALLLAFACSHHVGADLFRKVVFGASLDARRPVQVLQVLQAPVDHPVSIHHPEGAYLNGLLLRAV